MLRLTAHLIETINDGNMQKNLHFFGNTRIERMDIGKKKLCLTHRFYLFTPELEFKFMMKNWPLNLFYSSLLYDNE